MTSPCSCLVYVLQRFDILQVFVKQLFEFLDLGISSLINYG
jgi:hypothetical protein